MNILIVDDHPMNRKLLSAQLEAEGIAVSEAGDGAEALAALEREPADVVISDVLMPNMDGYQLCHTMRKTARLKNIPCILYSNTFVSESSRKLGLEFGADLFLNKPAPVEAILAAVHEVVAKGGWHAQRASRTVEHLKETHPYSKHLIRELERENTEADETRRRLLEVNHKLLLGTKRLETLEAELRESNEELERRVAERTAELQAANEELEAFSYSVSHDLRAPLRAIDGFSQAVVEDYGPQLPEECRRYLQTIRDGAQRMGALVDDLLAFSQLSRQPIKKQSITTANLVCAALEELGSHGQKSHEVQVGDLPPCEGDPKLLKQVWINLLSNALKYTRKRDCVIVEVGSMRQGGETVYFVRDNGTGFDMRYAGKLFGVFQRLHRVEDYEGTGVGLAIVQRIVHRHGGRVWADAAVDRGATFYFTLGGEARP